MSDRVLLGIDTGGTFTDVILYTQGRYFTVKTPTTNDFKSGVMTGLREVCAIADLDPRDIGLFNHGHTVATNALIEHEGASTALITSEGFTDVLEIGEGARRSNLLYDYGGEYVPPLIERKHRYEISERVTSNGDALIDLDESQATQLISKIKDEYESVAVCLLFSYQNPDHEHQIRSLFSELDGETELSLSSEVSPVIREYSRTATTVVDAFLKPTVKRYINDLATELADENITAQLNVMQSDGGVAHAAIASERPVKQLISGPAAGVKAAQRLGDIVDEPNLITFDMGGTSCDTAVIENGAPVEESIRDVAGMLINGPFIKINTVGAGGGSIAWISDRHELRVGPKSAGSDPGPVCYGWGGTDPTVSDADLLVGLLNPENFAGGQFDLNQNAAENAVQEHIADPLRLSVTEAVLGIRKIINTKMASAIRVISVKEGYDPRDFAVVGFGGAGPLHACEVASELEINTVLFPGNPGLFSAFGLLTTDNTHYYVQSVIETLPRNDPVSTSTTDRLTDVLQALISQGDNALKTEGTEPDDRSFSVSFDVMYTGQSHYLTIPLDQYNPVPADFEFSNEIANALLEQFEKDHRHLYGFVDTENTIELQNIRVSATGDNADHKLETPNTTTTLNDAKFENRLVTVTADDRHSVPCYYWNLIPPSSDIDGPAIVELDNSTIWIPPRFNATVDPYKNIIAEREGSHVN